mgnify:FL=1
MTLPEQIRDLRIKRGMTQNQLAAAAGVAQPQISKFEQELPPFRFSTLQKIAGALDCDIHVQLLPRWAVQDVCDEAAGGE